MKTETMRVAKAGTLRVEGRVVRTAREVAYAEATARDQSSELSPSRNTLRACLWVPAEAYVPSSVPSTATAKALQASSSMRLAPLTGAIALRNDSSLGATATRCHARSKLPFGLAPSVVGIPPGPPPCPDDVRVVIQPALLLIPGGDLAKDSGELVPPAVRPRARSPSRKREGATRVLWFHNDEAQETPEEKAAENAGQCRGGLHGGPGHGPGGRRLHVQ
jgi:hypothetical protein